MGRMRLGVGGRREGWVQGIRRGWRRGGERRGSAPEGREREREEGPDRATYQPQPQNPNNNPPSKTNPQQDLPGALSDAQVAEALELHAIKSRDWAIFKTSAIKGEGLFEGLDWLSNMLKSRR